MSNNTQESKWSHLLVAPVLIGSLRVKRSTQMPCVSASIYVFVLSLKLLYVPVEYPPRIKRGNGKIAHLRCDFP